MSTMAKLTAVLPAIVLIAVSGIPARAQAFADLKKAISKIARTMAVDLTIVDIYSSATATRKQKYLARRPASAQARRAMKNWQQEMARSIRRRIAFRPRRTSPDSR